MLMGGLHVANLSASFGLSGKICDRGSGEAPPCPLVASPIIESQDVTAPLPHIGASFDHRFSETLSGRLQVIGFAVELDSIDGGIIEVDADLIWQPWPNFGVGAGFRFFDFKVEANSSRLNGRFEYQYTGPVGYVLFTF